VSRYQKGKTNLDFTEARDCGWQWHQLGHMQVCTLLQTDNHASTPPLSFLQAGRPSCRPTNSVKALKATNSCINIHHLLYCLYHGLHGSASPVLMATGLVNGRWQFSTPKRIDTPQPITKKLSQDNQKL